MLIGCLETQPSSEVSTKIHWFSLKRNTLENITSKIAAVLPRPQCVNHDQRQHIILNQFCLLFAFLVSVHTDLIRPLFMQDIRVDCTSLGGAVLSWGIGSCWKSKWKHLTSNCVIYDITYNMSHWWFCATRLHAMINWMDVDHNHWSIKTSVTVWQTMS